MGLEEKLLIYLLSLLFCRYVFSSEILEVISSSSSIKPYSRICIQSYVDDTFLVAHEEEGQTSGRYTCMKILKRSDTVLQIKEAELSDRMGRDLCSDSNLKLDGWIIMDIKNVMNHREDCSLVGGFNTGVYDMSMNVPVCDGYVGETRLESECLPGNGLNFYYRQAKCVPDGLYMYPAQRTYCLANWEEENFQFSLLKHDRMNYLWIFRYPKDIDGNEKFTANLVKDLYATTGVITTMTTNFLKITMSRQSAKTLNHLCFDDYEICSVLRNPCGYSEDIARTCAKTCGFCSDLSPSVCQFNLPINGSWVDANHADKTPSVQINTTSIDIAGQETLHCVDWSGSKRASRATDEQPPAIVTSIGQNFRKHEQMLVTVSDNGCRPRFSCGKFMKLPSNVMFMQLTQTRLWPLVQSKEDPYDCSKFIYTSDKDVDVNPYRTRHEHLFILDHISHSVQCDLSSFGSLAVLFKDGVRCSGHLTQSASKDTVQLSFPECSVQRLRHKFTCLEHSKYSAEDDKLLVTKSHESPPKVHCWLFPKRPENTFYIIESEQCNSLMKRKIRKGRLRPIATFTSTARHTVPTEETIIPAEDEHIVKGFPSLNPSVVKNPQTVDTAVNVATTKSTPKHKDVAVTRAGNNEVEEGVEVDDVATTDGNITLTTSDADDKGKGSPVVVAAVLVTLIVMQIPLLCKCKC